MRIRQRARDVPQDRLGILGAERAVFPQAVADGSARDVLHDDRDRAVVDLLDGFVWTMLGWSRPATVGLPGQSGARRPGRRGSVPDGLDGDEAPLMRFQAR